MPTRLGVIGCGTVSYWTHLRLLPRIPQADLVAIADPDPVALARASAIVSARAFADPADLFAASDIDAVVIAAPTGLHADLAIAACAAGKHVYVEKPLAASVADARRVGEAVATADLVAVVGLHRRMHPAFEQARSLLAKGVVGPIRQVQTVFAEPAGGDGLPEWKRRRQSGGGVLLDLGVHHFDLVRWMLDQEVRVVTASIESRRTEHDQAAVQLESERGVTIQSLFSFASGPADMLVFAGERGVLSVDRHRARIECRVPRRFGYGTRRRWVPWQPADVGWRLRKLVRPSLEPSFERALTAFVHRVSGSGEVVDDLATIPDGIRAVELVDAAEQRASCASS